MHGRKFSLSILMTVLVALCACTSASAATPAQDVYNPDGAVLDFVATPTPTPTPVAETENECVESDSGSGNSDDNSGGEECGTTTPKSTTDTTTPTVVETADVQTPVVSSGELPFTGFEAGLVALMGLGLLGGGIAMRRFSRQD